MVARSMGVPYAAFLREKGASRKQKTLGVGDRFFNVLGRYVADGRVRPEGRSILLVDDIFHHRGHW